MDSKYAKTIVHVDQSNHHVRLLGEGFGLRMPFDSRNSNHNFPPTGQVIGFTCQKSTQNLLNKKPKRRDKSRSSNSLAVKFEAEKIELGPSQTTTSMTIPNLMATFAASTSTITAVSSIKVGLGTTQTTTVTATSVDVLVFTPDPTPKSVPRTNVRKSNYDTGYTTSVEVSLPKKGHESMFLVSQRSSKLEHTDGMELLRKALDELSPELANICVKITGNGSESDQSSVLSSLALRETPLDSQSRDGEDDNNSVLSDITVIPYQGRHISSSASSSTGLATQIWSPLSSGKTGPGGRSSTDGGVLLDNEVEIPQFTFNPCDYTDDPDECILISMGILCTYKELQCKISNMRLHWNAKPQEECLRRGKITPRKYKFPASISTPSSRPGVFEISYNSTVNISWPPQFHENNLYHRRHFHQLAKLHNHKTFMKLCREYEADNPWPHIDMNEGENRARWQGDLFFHELFNGEQDKSKVGASKGLSENLLTLAQQFNSFSFRKQIEPYIFDSEEIEGMRFGMVFVGMGYGMLGKVRQPGTWWKGRKGVFEGMMRRGFEEEVEGRAKDIERDLDLWWNQREEVGEESLKRKRGNPHVNFEVRVLGYPQDKRIKLNCQRPPQVMSEGWRTRRRLQEKKAGRWTDGTLRMTRIWDEFHWAEKF